MPSFLTYGLKKEVDRTDWAFYFTPVYNNLDEEASCRYQVKRKRIFWLAIPCTDFTNNTNPKAKIFQFIAISYINNYAETKNSENNRAPYGNRTQDLPYTSRILYQLHEFPSVVEQLTSVWNVMGLIPIWKSFFFRVF